MQYKCDKCNDSGSLNKFDPYYDCISCDAAEQRVALEKWCSETQQRGPSFDDCWAIHQRALAMAPKQEVPTQEPVAYLVFAGDHNGMAPQHPAYSTHLQATRCASMFGQTPTEIRPLYDHAAPAAANGALADADIHRIAQENGIYDDNIRPSGEMLESFARAILAAAGPDAALIKALEMAVQQNECDMLMTGEECRQCRAALSGAKGN